VVCELQSHNTEDQTNANQLIYDFSQKYNLPYTITTDAYMLSDFLKESHAMFVEIGEGREVGESYTDCYFTCTNSLNRITYISTERYITQIEKDKMCQFP